MEGCSKTEFSEDSEKYVLGCLWASIWGRFESLKSHQIMKSEPWKTLKIWVWKGEAPWEFPDPGYMLGGG